MARAFPEISVEYDADISCNIVSIGDHKFTVRDDMSLQSQKVMFEDWGETLWPGQGAHLADVVVDELRRVRNDEAS